MKVTILHNLYQHPGGEDVVAAAEANLLAKAGHTVHLETVTNSAIRTAGDKIRALVRASFDPVRYEWARDLFNRTRPDVVHVHNFFPLLTPAVHQAARDHGAAVVQSLHNFRLLCSNATFLREGAVCEDCLGGSRLPGVLHRCYRGSLPGSVAVWRMQASARRRCDVDLFIALTAFARQKFAQGGLPAERIVIKPNFMEATFGQERKRSGALYVGRISDEKGVADLVEAWRNVPDTLLTIVGDGPERTKLEAAAGERVRFAGQVDAEAVREMMCEASCLVVPSVWYEGFPMVVVEAFASGLPVLASRLGSLGEIVEDGVNGRHFTAGDAASIARVVRETFASGELTQLGAGARQTHTECYEPTRNLALLEGIYADAITSARERQDGLGL